MQSYLFYGQRSANYEMSMYICMEISLVALYSASVHSK